MSARKQSPTRPRRPGAAAAESRAAQSPPIFRAMVVEALESWVVPTLSIAAAALFWLLSALDVCPEPVTVVGIAGSLLVLALFSSFRHHLFANEPLHRYSSLAFCSIWGLLLFTTFYLCNFPGAPLAGGVLRRGGEAVVLPPGSHAVIADGRFVGRQGEGNRLGRYRLEILPSEGSPKAIEGNFEDTFARQRLGRRGTTVVEIQHTSQRHFVTLSYPAKMTLSEIDPSLESELRVAVYPAMNRWLFSILGVAGIVGALMFEKWLDGDGSVTMAASVTFFVVDQYLRWSSPHPQLRSLIGAILVGGFIGAPLAAAVWWVVPRRWIVRQR